MKVRGEKRVIDKHLRTHGTLPELPEILVLEHGFLLHRQHLLPLLRLLPESLDLSLQSLVAIPGVDEVLLQLSLSLSVFLNAERELVLE